MWDFESFNDAPWYRNNNTAYSAVKIGDQVTYIGSNAFADMISLKTLRIPSSVTALSPRFVIGCRKLLYVCYGGTQAQLAGVEGISSLPTDRAYEIYALSSGRETADGCYYTEMAAPGELISRTVLMTWRIAGSVLTVGGDDRMANFNDFSETPWAHLADRVTELVLCRNIHTFGHHTFDGMSRVTSISLPSSSDLYYDTAPTYRISATAFSGTAYYNDPKNYTEDGALYIGKFLIRVDATRVGSAFVMREGTEAVAENAFADCDGVRMLVFRSTADKGIYSTAFAGLTSLTHFLYHTPTLSTTALPSTVAERVPSGTAVGFFREQKPTGTEGVYWHFDADGKTPILW